MGCPTKLAETTFCSTELTNRHWRTPRSGLKTIGDNDRPVTVWAAKRATDSVTPKRTSGPEVEPSSLSNDEGPS
jgi:hypothetical protein